MNIFKYFALIFVVIMCFSCSDNNDAEERKMLKLGYKVGKDEGIASKFTPMIVELDNTEKTFGSVISSIDCPQEDGWGIAYKITESTVELLSQTYGMALWNMTQEELEANKINPSKFEENTGFVGTFELKCSNSAGELTSLITATVKKSGEISYKVDKLYKDEQGLYYAISGNEATVIDYAGSATELVIPPLAKTAKVVTIKEKTFKNNKTLQTVVISDTVKTVGHETFYHCSALKSINLPASLKTVGDGAFAACDLLETLVIPSALKEVKFNVYAYLENGTPTTFYGCPLLSSDTQDSLKAIGYNGSFVDTSTNKKLTE